MGTPYNLRSGSAGQGDLGALFQKYPHIDPITFQVIGKGLESICREMGTMMVRTAYSAVFVEGQDFSCAILDDLCELVAAANFDPSHLSAMAYAAEWAVIDIGIERLAPGDVIIHNDPYRGGTHLADFTVLQPIFYHGELVTIAANRAHHLDVGGKSVGGFPGDATEIYAEGFRLPPVRWFKAGVENTEIIDTLLLNVRIPEVQMGDFRAQLASLTTAEKRILEYCDKYGVQAVRETMKALKDYSERQMRAEIAEIPDGAYTYEDFMDDDGPSEQPYRIRATVTISGSDMIVDFTGTSRQAQGPVNSAYGMTASSTFNALLQLSGPNLYFNHGCFRPIRIIAPRGSVVNPNPPAPVFGGVTDTSIRIIDVIMGALAQAIPDRVIAATYGTCNNFAGGGYDPFRQRDYVFYFFTEGGWGASASRDGWNVTPNQTSNYKDYPVEIIESQFPLRCSSVELYQDSGGPGRNRGGIGVIRRLTLLGPAAKVNGLGERHRFRPYGLAGGWPGAANALLICKAGTQEFKTFKEQYCTISASKFADIPWQTGDTVAFVMGGGGGYGDPLDRDPERVLDDVQEELVSPAAARDCYGVVITGSDGELAVDAAATRDLRSQLRATRGAYPHVVNGIVDVDETSWHARSTNLDSFVPPPPDETDERIEKVRRAIPEEYCKTQCPKAAHPKQCPYHNQEALRFWSLEALRTWTARNCPLGLKL